MIDCKEAANFLFDYMSRELSKQDLTRLEEHLDACEPCRGHAEFERALKELLKKKSAEIHRICPEFQKRLLDQIKNRPSSQ